MTALFYQNESVMKFNSRCALQYVLLHLLGYQLSIDDLKAFRQVGSKTPGHPEAGHTDGKFFFFYSVNALY